MFYKYGFQFKGFEHFNIDIDTTLYIMSDINELKSKLSLCYGDIDTTTTVISTQQLR